MVMIEPPICVPCFHITVCCHVEYISALKRRQQVPPKSVSSILEVFDTAECIHLALK
jgi:hypothetical protein